MPTSCIADPGSVSRCKNYKSRLRHPGRNIETWGKKNLTVALSKKGKQLIDTIESRIAKEKKRQRRIKYRLKLLSKRAHKGYWSTDEQRARARRGMRRLRAKKKGLL